MRLSKVTMQVIAYVTRTAPAAGLVYHCRLFEMALSEGGIVKMLRIPNGKAISNARIKTQGDVASKTLIPAYIYIHERWSKGNGT